MSLLSVEEIFRAAREGSLPPDFHDWGIMDENGDTVADWALARPETPSDIRKAAGEWLNSRTGASPESERESPALTSADEFVGSADKDGQERIEDTFGEKIGGSRRDIQRRFTEDDFSLAGFDGLDIMEAGKIAVKDRLWPEPDWVALSGDPRRSLRVRLLRDALPNVCPGAMNLRNYIRLVREFRDECETYAGEDGDHLKQWDSRDALHGMKFPGLHSSSFNRIKDVFNPLYQKVYDNQLASLSGWPTITDSPMLDGYWPVYLSGKGYAVLKSSPKRISTRFFETLEQCVDWINGPMKEALANKSKSMGERVEPVRPQLDAHERRGPDYGVTEVTPEMFQETFGFRGGEFGSWLTQEERRESLRNAYYAFMDLAYILRVEPKRIGGGKLGFAFGARGRGKYAAHFEPERVVINLTRNRGAGAVAHEWAHFLDYSMAGAGVSAGRPSSGMDWLWKKELTNAEICEARQMKAEKTLAILETWVRIKKPEQCGVIMAELRSLDVMSGQFGQLYRSAVSECVKGPKNRRAFLNAMESLKSDATLRYGPTRFYAEAEKLDKGRSKKYWTTEPELFARVFESYVNAKLRENGRTNSYLVSLFEHPNADMYPSKDEMEDMFPHIEEFLDNTARDTEDETEGLRP
jgi:hypothetical protein